MTGSVTQIWRHPIKSHGREPLDQVSLTAGQTMPGDRIWAVAHELSTADGSEWVPCQNFNRGSKAPRLMAIDAHLDDASGAVTLTHPDRPELTFAPDDAEDHARRKTLDDADAAGHWFLKTGQHRPESSAVLTGDGRTRTWHPSPCAMRPPIGLLNGPSDIRSRRNAGAETCGSTEFRNGRSSIGSAGKSRLEMLF